MAQAKAAVRDNTDTGLMETGAMQAQSMSVIQAWSVHEFLLAVKQSDAHEVLGPAN